ncbi:putative Dedicator of cytokinesis protein 6 [Blattamonas nauphoetae]|uniref:Dedicator of cytokinesis protein 6 n=1 Tax=Blattamonas nauphoetae TaxID=2049346 RepID=A0ABQ9X0F6_9EUKA|nr:putative Dedicator of cytokinesis protein 6 [Blattamonas nauphoetae]
MLNSPGGEYESSINFSTLKGTQLQLEERIKSSSDLPEGVVPEPISVKIEVGSSDYAKYELLSSLSNTSLYTHVSTHYTAPQTTISFSSSINQSSDIHYPTIHFDPFHPNPIFVPDDPSQSNQSDTPPQTPPREDTPKSNVNPEDDNTPENEENADNKEENEDANKTDSVTPVEPKEKPQPLQLDIDQDEEISPKYTDAETLPPKSSDSLTGRQICGILFRSSHREQPILSLCGNSPQPVSEKKIHGIYARPCTISFDQVKQTEMEPIFLSFSLYATDSICYKLSEDVLIDLNPQKARKIRGDVFSNPELLTTLSRMLFSVDPEQTPNVSLVMVASKVMTSDDKKALKHISQELTDYFQNYGQFLTPFCYTVVPLLRGGYIDQPQTKPDNLKKLTNVDLYHFKEKEYMSDGMGKLIQMVERKNADKIQGSLCLDLIFLQETRAERIVDDRMREREVKEKGIPDHEGQISEKKEINKSLKVDYSEDSTTRLTKLPRLITSFIPPKSLSSVPPFHTLYFTPLTVDLTDARNIVFRIRFFAEEAELPVVNEDPAFLVEDPSTLPSLTSSTPPLPIIASRFSPNVFMTEAWSSTFYHVEKPRFPDEFKIYLPLAPPPPATSLKAPFQPAQSALPNLAFPFGSPASAGGRKASVASPNPHSGSTVGASGQTGSSAMPHFNLPANWPQGFHAVVDIYQISFKYWEEQKKGAQSKKERLKKVGSTCIPLTSLDRLSDDREIKMIVWPTISQKQYLKVFEVTGESKGTGKTDSKTKTFTFQTRLVSSFIPLNANIRNTLIKTKSRIPLDILLDTLRQQSVQTAKLNMNASLSTLTPINVRDGFKTRSVNLFIPALLTFCTESMNGKGDADRLQLLEIMLQVVNVADSSIRRKDVYTEDPVVDWVNRVFNMTEVRNYPDAEQTGGGIIRLVKSPTTPTTSATPTFMEPTSRFFLVILRLFVLTSLRSVLRTLVDSALSHVLAKESADVSKDVSYIQAVREAMHERIRNKWNERKGVTCVDDPPTGAVTAANTHRNSIASLAKQTRRHSSIAKSSVSESVVDSDDENDKEKKEEGEKKDDEEKDPMDADEPQDDGDSISGKSQPPIPNDDEFEAPMDMDDEFEEIKMTINQRDLAFMDGHIALLVDAIVVSEEKLISEDLAKDDAEDEASNTLNVIPTAFIDELLKDTQSKASCPSLNDITTCANLVHALVLKSLILNEMKRQNAEEDGKPAEERLRKIVEDKKTKEKMEVTTLDLPSIHNTLPPEFYNLLHSHTLLLSLSLLNINAIPSSIACSTHLAYFFSSLWMIADRGRVNELVLVFLSTFYDFYFPKFLFDPSLCLTTIPFSTIPTPHPEIISQDVKPPFHAIQTLSKGTANRIRQSILSFWNVLTQSPHWLSLAFFSSPHQQNTGEMTIRRRSEVRAFLPTLLTLSLFSFEDSHLHDVKKHIKKLTRQMNAGHKHAASFKFSRPPALAASQMLSSVSVAQPPMTPDSIAQSVVFDDNEISDKEDDDFFDPDMGDISTPSGTGPDKKASTNLTSPFTFIRSIFSRIDCRSISPLTRRTFADLHFVYFPLALSHSSLHSSTPHDAPSLKSQTAQLSGEDKLNCYLSMIWLLMNASLSTIRSFFASLSLQASSWENNNLTSFLNLATSFVTFFVPASIHEFIRSPFQDDIDSLQSLIEEQKKKKTDSMPTKRQGMKIDTSLFSGGGANPFGAGTRSPLNPQAPGRTKSVALSREFQRASTNMSRFSMTGLSPVKIGSASPKSSLTQLSFSPQPSGAQPSFPGTLKKDRKGSLDDPNPNDSPSPTMMQTLPSRGKHKGSIDRTAIKSMAISSSRDGRSSPLTIVADKESIEAGHALSSRIQSIQQMMDDDSEDKKALDTATRFDRIYKESVSHMAYSLVVTTVMSCLSNIIVMKTTDDDVVSESEWINADGLLGDDLAFKHVLVKYGMVAGQDGVVLPADDAEKKPKWQIWRINFVNFETQRETFNLLTRSNHPNINLSDVLVVLSAMITSTDSSQSKQSSHHQSAIVDSGWEATADLMNTELAQNGAPIDASGMALQVVTRFSSLAPLTFNLSVETLEVVMSFLRFVIRLSAHDFFIEEVDLPKLICEAILTFFSANSTRLRSSSVDFIWFLFKLNTWTTGRATRMRRIMTAFVSQTNFEDSTQKLFLESLSGLLERSETDPDRNEELTKYLQVLIDRLKVILEEKAEVRRLEGLDDELKAERAYTLTLNYAHTPELRLGTYSLLESILKTGSIDELAMAQVSKCAVILDVLTEMWRRRHMSLSFPFPQELPIRSDYASLVGSNIELVQKTFVTPAEGEEAENDDMAQGIAAPSAPSLPQKRRYGTSWVCYDLIMKEIIPTFKLYTPLELNTFFSNPDTLSAIEESKQYTYENAVEQVTIAAKWLDEAKLFELSILMRQILVALLRAANNHEKLAETYRDMSTAATNTNQELSSRLTCMYYRIGLYGADFGEENGSMFISKEYNFMKLGDFKFKLIDKYKKKLGKEPTILMGDVPPELTEEEMKTPHIQLGAVRPLFSTVETHDRPTPFTQQTNLKIFKMETPFTQTPIKKPGMHETWLRIVTFECENPLPFVSRRAKVIPSSVTVEDVSPAMFSARDIITKTQAIRKATDPLDQKGIQPLVSGAIAPQVNEGVMSIYRCFLGEHKDETSEADLEAIKLAFVDFFMACRAALIKMEEIKNLTAGFIDVLADKYNELMDEVAAELKGLPKIVKGVDYDCEKNE